MITGSWIRRERTLVIVVLAALLPIIFFGVAHFNLRRAQPSPRWLVTPLDGAFPFFPSAIWIYASWYLGVGTVLIAPVPVFRRAWKAYLAVFMVCVCLFLVLPVTISRPSVGLGGGQASQIVAFLYRHDPPTNLFPSFHAAIATVIAGLSRGRLRVIVWVWATAVCISCILLKQHYVLDVLGGVVSGAFGLWLSAGRWFLCADSRS